MSANTKVTRRDLNAARARPSSAESTSWSATLVVSCRALWQTSGPTSGFFDKAGSVVW
ncbi:hypothetical protein [Lentzea indica]|uniref:hypothetical protein n=1 Tax=Lentzea indica TaxID=2604800 RepID=UPI00143B4289|nr:hypothetical protein [Lentzea indica]